MVTAVDDGIVKNAGVFCASRCTSLQSVALGPWGNVVVSVPSRDSRGESRLCDGETPPLLKFLRRRLNYGSIL